MSYHANEPIHTIVVDTPYGGGVSCLMWWIRNAEAGYCANVVGIILVVVDFHEVPCFLEGILTL